MLYLWQGHTGFWLQGRYVAGSMSITALRQLLVEKLGERDAERFRDGQLQNLLDKEYKDEGALQDATRDGLGTPPPLPAALIDKILKAFGQPGEKLGMRL